MNTPKIEQWMRDAAQVWHPCDNGLRNALVTLIAHHSPAQPAELPSIWKPVSQRPTEEDGDFSGSVLFLDEKSTAPEPRRYDNVPRWATHWCRTADLLARCPLPKVKTQFEKDLEWLNRMVPATPGNDWIMKLASDALAYGRATANTEEKK